MPGRRDGKYGAGKTGHKHEVLFHQLGTKETIKRRRRQGGEKVAHEGLRERCLLAEEGGEGGRGGGRACRRNEIRERV